jgi:hypothetical protein
VYIPRVSHRNPPQGDLTNMKTWLNCLVSKIPASLSSTVTLQYSGSTKVECTRHASCLIPNRDQAASLDPVAAITYERKPKVGQAGSEYDQTHEFHSRVDRYTRNCIPIIYGPWKCFPEGKNVYEGECSCI